MSGKTLPRIVIYTTGGTIQCSKDAISGKVAPALTGAQMLERLTALKERFLIEVIELFNMPGSDLTLSEGMELVKSIREMEKRSDIDGIVVLQGTDTMDEIPYFVNVTVRCEKPVVFTGSMKSSHDLYSDAPRQRMRRRDGGRRPAVARPRRPRLLQRDDFFGGGRQ